VSGDRVWAGEACGDWTQVKFLGQQRDSYGWVESSRLTSAVNTDPSPTCAKLDKPGATARDLPAEVRPFVLDKDKENVRWLYCADLNGDGRADYLLVTELLTRYFQILIRQPDGTLESVIRSENVFNANIGGGDMDRLSVRKMGFAVTNDEANTPGSSGRATVFRFQYSPKEKTWILSHASRSDWGQATGAPDDSFEKTPKDFGHVTINTFDYRDY
jgi:hypothetical protein